MSEKRSRPAGEPGGSEVIAATTTNVPLTSDDLWRIANECPAESKRWFGVGWQIGQLEGFDRGFRRGHVTAEGSMQRAWSVVAAGVRAGADTPSQAALTRRRDSDHKPCRDASCHGRCSRCIHAAAWNSRGGRPYLGVEGERRRERVAA